MYWKFERYSRSCSSSLVWKTSSLIVRLSDRQNNVVETPSDRRLGPSRRTPSSEPPSVAKPHPFFLPFVQSRVSQCDCAGSTGFMEGNGDLLEIGVTWLLVITLNADDMSGGTPTLIPRKPIYPAILPHPPVANAIPMPPPKKRCYRGLNSFRNIFNEMDDLSDEENELDDEVSALIMHPNYLKAVW